MLCQAFGLLGLGALRSCHPGQWASKRLVHLREWLEHHVVVVCVLVVPVAVAFWLNDASWPNNESSCSRSSFGACRRRLCLGDTKDASPLCAPFHATMTGTSQGLEVAEAGPPRAVGVCSRRSVLMQEPGGRTTRTFLLECIQGASRL